jgi:hypothetical protein
MTSKTSSRGAVISSCHLDHCGGVVPATPSRVGRTVPGQRHLQRLLCGAVQRGPQHQDRRGGHPNGQHQLGEYPGVAGQAQAVPAHQDAGERRRQSQGHQDGVGQQPHGQVAGADQLRVAADQGSGVEGEQDQVGAEPATATTTWVVSSRLRQRGGSRRDGRVRVRVVGLGIPACRDCLAREPAVRRWLALRGGQRLTGLARLSRPIARKAGITFTRQRPLLSQVALWSWCRPLTVGAGGRGRGRSAGRRRLVDTAVRYGARPGSPRWARQTARPSRSCAPPAR